MIKKLLFTVSFLTSLNAITELSKNELKNIQDLDFFANANIKVEKAYSTKNFYALRINAQGDFDEVFLTKDKKYLITGEVLDTTSGDNLFIPADLKGVRGKEAFIYGSGDDEYFLFTDPECPYCKKLESYFPQIEKYVKIRVFYFPLGFLPNAKNLSLFILSKKTTKEKINTMLNLKASDKNYINRKYSPKQLLKLEKQLEEQIYISEKLHIQGTPGLLDTKGNRIAWPSMLEKYGIKIN